jgi:hypothetical protein
VTSYSTRRERYIGHGETCTEEPWERREPNPRKISTGRAAEIRRSLRAEAAIVNRDTPLTVRLESPAFTPMA